MLVEGSYKDWKQVAGYFDGDGSSDFKIGKRVVFVRLSLRITDHSSRQSSSS